MIKRIYVHNFRCLENFEFKQTDCPSVLFMGKNGSGKSTLREALKIFQSIGRGTLRIRDLVEKKDFCRGQSTIPMRFELEVQLKSILVNYMIALELPERFKELRIKEEKLSVNGDVLFSREQALVTVYRSAENQHESRFNIDWHMVAMPLIEDPSTSTSLGMVKNWLSKMVLLAPIPKLMASSTENDNTEPDENAVNWAGWLSGLLDRYPAAYATIDQYLKHIMPDLDYFRFEPSAGGGKTLMVCFSRNKVEFELDAKLLSDGEKCFFLCAVLLAVNKHDGPLFTFWDEPDSHLSLDEISQFVMSLRKGFQHGGQLVMTSHNPEAIRRFSNDSTWVLGRRSHLEPTIIRQLQDIAPSSDLIENLINGDISPWL